MAAVNTAKDHRRQLTYTGSLCLYLLLAVLAFSLSVATIGDGHKSVRLSKAYIEKLGREYGHRAKRRLRNWQRLLDNLQNDSEAEKIRKVNDFFNKVRFVNDINHWKKEDYWATPVEFLITNGGDCEDFSIAKYYTLREVGVPDSKMSIAYVKAIEYNQAHMVLTYYKTPDSMPVILDNLIPQIKPANQRPDLIHVYSFNGDNLWLTKKGRRAEIVGTSDRLEHWVKLRSRLENQTVNSVK
ncbi:transglutaminase-like cysteine peptidase [Pontibacterium sinense]|uniref:transglutaminase-like cysteine peptidase n=1 Tax=Pontibacterium sinense TaxID=2781979 RepID=UPI0035313BDF